MDDCELKFGDETVMTTAVVDNKLHIVYGTGWEQYLQEASPEFAKVVDEAQKKLSRIAPNGKGKGKNSGPE